MTLFRHFSGDPQSHISRTALNMAEKHGIPQWLVSLSYLKGLLMSDGEGASSSESVMAAVASSEVMRPLLEAAGDECWRRMDAELFPLVDGGDADVVWAFVALVDKVGGTASVFGTSKKQLKKVVEKLRSVALDFKVCKAFPQLVW